jgi:putative DNA primase/helicase
VRAMTAEYFDDQDSVNAWLEECCDRVPDAFATIQDLFASWRMRCATLGEPAGTVRQLGQALANRGFERDKHPRNRRSGFNGLTVRPIDMADGLERLA